MILMAPPFRLDVVMAGTEKELDDQVEVMRKMGWHKVGANYVRRTVDSMCVACIIANTVPNAHLIELVR